MKGFTLIELMVVMLIILILTGGSITAYLNFNKTQSITNDSRALVSEIYRVRTLASSQQYPAGCTSLKGYNMASTEIDGELSGVVVVAVCQPSNVTIKTAKLLASSLFTAAFNITFLPGSGYLQSGQDQQIVIANNKDSSLTKSVSVGSYGLVKVN